MKRFKKHIIYLLLISLFTALSCIEEIELKTETFESALVIEATITNEVKQQKILLSRTFSLESEDPSSTESNAIVKVISNNGIEYSFNETELGTYLSVNTFAAQPNVDYHLEVTTSDGKLYSSKVTQLTKQAQIDDLYVERSFNENGKEGVSIFVDSFDPTDDSKFYRYTYEETYKVIAPLYQPFELIVINDDFPYSMSVFTEFDQVEFREFFVKKQSRKEQKQICYNTTKSKEILVVDLNDLDQGNLQQYRVKFISRNNYIISHRYSILVKQHVQSRDAHTYYKILNNLSSSESLFSQIQTGFLNGNIFSLNNPNEKVIGFFEVSYTDLKRVYFNYKDLFPGDILPPYYIPDCDDIFFPELFRTDPLTGAITGSPLQEAIKDGHQFWEYKLTDGDIDFYLPYKMVFSACGDCTVLGKTEIPDFWEE